MPIADNGEGRCNNYICLRTSFIGGPHSEPTHYTNVAQLGLTLAD